MNNTTLRPGSILGQVNPLSNIVGLGGGLGAALVSALTATAALFFPWLSFVAFAPLFVVLRESSPWQAFFYGAITAALPAAYYVINVMPFAGGRLFEIGSILWLAVVFGGLMAIVGLAWNRLPVASGLLLLPLGVMAFSWIAELPLGRFVNLWALGLVRLPWVLMIGNLGSHLLVVGLLGLTSAIVALGWIERNALSSVALPLTIALLVVIAGLIYGKVAFVQLQRAVADAPKIRVAAIASDLGVHAVGGVSQTQSPDARSNVSLVLATYGKLVEQAVTQGAQVVVLPEAHVFVTETNATQWRPEIASWARQHRIFLIAGYFDLSAMRDLAVAFDPTGAEITVFEKRHPVPGFDPPTQVKTGPGVVMLSDQQPLSFAICFDMNFADITNDVRQRGGLFAVPANDWREIAEKHHSLVTWSAIASRVSVIRATTHGISSLTDPTGQVIARASSFDGDVVLVGDVPMLAAQ